MGEGVLVRIAACVVCATLLYRLSEKQLGAMQQSGYKNRTFLRWLSREDNLLFNRYSVLALCLVLASAVTALCFSFLGVTQAQLVSGIPFLALLLFACFADGKYALKVSTAQTPRLRRLSLVYFFFLACLSYIFIAFLTFLSAWNPSKLYDLIAFVPYGIIPLTMPFLLCLANAVAGLYDNAKNKRFINRATQTLKEKKLIRIGVVGSYGKTSVKNILKTLLAEKYAVIETPQSYNTPIGIAKTVFSDGFENAEVLIAEMGARKQGDIAELCAMVEPDFAIFTGVCAQHIHTFGSVENAFAEKSEIIKSGAFTICSESLRARVENAFDEEHIAETVLFAGAERVKDERYLPTETQFTLCLGEEEIKVSTPLLSHAAVENITLAATLAYECLGLSVEQIQQGISKLAPIPHRLQLLKSGGAYILDDGYNSNPEGAKEAIAALSRFAGRKCVVTPGLVECGILEETLNAELGETLAKASLDKVILVGDTLVGAVKTGYLTAVGNVDALSVVKTLDEAKDLLSKWVGEGDCVLFLNDLPDVY